MEFLHEIAIQFFGHMIVGAGVSFGIVSGVCMACSLFGFFTNETYI